jgi:tRNA 2-selenouridine synthase
VIIGGRSGTGKTHILKALKSLGEQVIDLEAEARHNGSAFGFVGNPKQPKSE